MTDEKEGCQLSCSKCQLFSGVLSSYSLYGLSHHYNALTYVFCLEGNISLLNISDK